ncbi:MAG: magnesium chelatase, partial [Acidobacteria bacterium]|nr:magnesium chelatase [Acidobacteriota bacterium]
PRMGDLYFALPAITGKIELEYEGEVRGNEEVARELIRSATAVSFSKHLGGDECRDIVEWFNSGHQLQISADGSTSQNLGEVRRVPGLMERIHRMVDQRPSDELALSAAEFILEGLHAHQLIGRSEEREGTLYGPGRVRRDTAVM